MLDLPRHGVPVGSLSHSLLPAKPEQRWKQDGNLCGGPTHIYRSCIAPQSPENFLHIIVSILRRPSCCTREKVLGLLAMSSLLLNLAVASLVASFTAAASNGDFNILSFNVAGLPSILNDNDVPGDKATNAGTIGTLFTKYDYDVIHVQEGTNQILQAFGLNADDHVRLCIPCRHLRYG